jgi:drug/metabolite transporter (DMT)-like permease
MKATSSLLAANLICMVSMLVWAAGLPAAAVIIPLLPPLQLSAARMTLGALALLPIWLAMEGIGVFRGAGWLKGVGVGGLIALGALFVVIGQKMTGPVTLAIISATMPLIGIALEVVLDGKRLTLGLVVGLLLSVLGALVALGGGVGGLHLGLGALVCLASVICFTLGSRLTVTAYPQLSPLGRTTVTLTGAAIATLIVAGFDLAQGTPRPDFAGFGLKEIAALLAFSVGGLAISQVLWIVSVGRLGIGLASLHINATPFYVMLILFAFGAPWNWLQALGAAIVGLGVLVAQGIIPLSPRAVTI